MPNLDGKVALITGGAEGTGAAHGEVFVNAGAKVVLADVRDTEGEAIADKLGVQARYQHLDVTSTDSWAAAIATALETFGRLDVLVNVAGICPVVSFDDTTAEQITTVLKINTVGPFLGMQAAARVMQPGSVIVNIGSIDALRGAAGLCAYGASKAALKSLNKTAAVVWAPKGISVLCLHPGGIDTPMLYDAGNALMELAGVPADQADINAALKTTIPLGRVAQPHEITEWSAFIAATGAATAGGNVGI